MGSDAYEQLLRRALGCGLLLGKERDPHETTVDGVAALLSSIGGRWEEWQEFDYPTVDLIGGLSEREWNALRHVMTNRVRHTVESVRNRRAGLISDLETIRVFDAIR